MKTEGSARDPLFVVAPCSPCQPPLTQTGLIPGGTSCAPSVSFIPSSAWQLTAADRAGLTAVLIPDRGTLNLAWSIDIPDRVTDPTRPKQQVSVDWQVVCTFPDGESLGYDTVMPWVGAVEISGFTPDSGPSAGGTRVTVHGHGFTNASAVRFGTQAGLNLDVVNDDTIDVSSPPGQRFANVTLHVVAPAGSADGSTPFGYD